MEEFDAVVFTEEKTEKKTELLSEEVPLTLEVNGRELATLLCSPTDLEDFVTGFLYTAGILTEPASLKNLVLDRDRWKANITLDDVGLSEDMLNRRVYTSGCGRGVIYHNPLDLLNRGRVPFGFTVSPAAVSSLMKEFLTHSAEHRQTRGVHSCALADGKDIVIFRDDIGRHNALDKVIGGALRKNLGFSETLLLSSGRISSEIISKTMRPRIPVVASAGAPTNQAVKLAGANNLTLIGFARGRRMTVFCGEERVIRP